MTLKKQIKELQDKLAHCEKHCHELKGAEDRNVDNRKLFPQIDGGTNSPQQRAASSPPAAPPPPLQSLERFGVDFKLLVPFSFETPDGRALTDELCAREPLVKRFLPQRLLHGHVTPSALMLHIFSHPLMFHIFSHPLLTCYHLIPSARKL